MRSTNPIRNPRASGNHNNCRNNINKKEWKQIQQSSPSNSKHSGKSQQFDSLERAFKATDILLHHGGFALIAVNLSCIDETRLHKIPLTTWFRFARVADDTQTALVFLTSSPLAFSCVGLKLHVDGSLSSWSSNETKHVESRYAPESLGAEKANNSTEKSFRPLLEQYG